ncbi:uncharacterized protein LOC116004515 [Ipomoea triloba]|uniref:uncharacterized protein LOC116004515 n=1 Tax=Ipomoea triloba TaxID=35885 RepID=UPI00125DF447|nr:uncharacterized protein LOC116004515 [Ipomoea triloba]
MAEVFARSVATGGLAISSTQMPPNSDDERLDEFLHSARLSSTATNTGGTRSKGKRRLDDKMNIGGSTRKSTNKKWKDQIIDVLESVNATMISKEHRRKAREKASTTVATPYTMKACIEILKNMSGIPPLCHYCNFQAFGKS